MESFNFNNNLGKLFLSFVQKYNHNKYWHRRALVVNPNNKTPILLKLYFLYYIKKRDSYHNCSFGTNLHSGTIFKSPPILPHGPNGIIVGHDLIVGKNVTIFHQVTLSHGGSIIGDDVMFGAGSKLLPSCNVGDNVKVGANCVVVENIPTGATVVMCKPRIILK